MSSLGSVDQLIASYFNEGPTDLGADRRAAIVAAAEQISQRRGFVGGWDARSMRLLRVAVAVVLIAVTSALLIPRLDDVVGVFRPEPTSLYWTQESYTAPYPAPFRSEPLFGRSVVTATIGNAGSPDFPRDPTWVVRDAIGDASPINVDAVDITKVEYKDFGCWTSRSICVKFDVSRPPSRPLVDPRTEWIAYGIVLDNDLDGRPDVRVGLDNRPGGSIRSWRTHLATGSTSYILSELSGTADHPMHMEVEYPTAMTAERTYHGYFYLSWGLSGPEGHFYVWAAVIRDGEIVAMDFAPDAGWIDGRDEDPNP
jgi:hypothetical protein